MTSHTKHSATILSKIISADQAEIHLKIPQDLTYFEGHFIDMPVVPGVVQLHWVVKYLKDFFHIEAPITKGTQLKFMNLMQPNHTPILTLNINRETSQVTYKYHTEDAVYSSGKLSYDA